MTQLHIPVKVLIMWPKFLRLFGFLFVVAQVSGGPCPSGFSHYYRNGTPTSVSSRPYEASCYKFSSDQRTWTDSRRQCRALGGDLVSIESAGEQSHLETVIRNNSALQRPALTKSRDWGYWTSGTDGPKEGSWVWAATGRRISYRNWNSGQPNNNYGSLPQDCMQLRPDYGWKWNDHICYLDVVSYVCEKKSFVNWQIDGSIQSDGKSKMIFA